MNESSKIILLLRQEEGVTHEPYIDSLGYPTVGVGFKLGPRGIPLSHYTFSLEDETINCWLRSHISIIQKKMTVNSGIANALIPCNQARQDILTSMAYQMGVNGLAYFHKALTAISQEDWEEAATQMLNSTWAKQTPARAWRHAGVMRSGRWRPVYDF